MLGAVDGLGEPNFQGIEQSPPGRADDFLDFQRDVRLNCGKFVSAFGFGRAFGLESLVINHESIVVALKKRLAVASSSSSDTAIR